MRDIGKNIRQLRLEKNMTQDELAERLFVGGALTALVGILWLLGIPGRRKKEVM